MAWPRAKGEFGQLGTGGDGGFFRNYFVEYFCGPEAEAFDSGGDGLAVLDVGLDFAFDIETDLALPCAKNFVAHQRAILEIGVQQFAVNRAVDDAGGRRAVGLGKIQGD